VTISITLDPAWAGMIGALGGVALGGAIEHFRNRAAFKRERKWELAEARRQRLERIFELLYEIERAFELTLTRCATIARIGKGTSPEPSERVPWEKLGVLISLYHREMIQEVEALKKAGEHLTLTCVKWGMQKSPDPPGAIGKMMASHERFAAAIQALRQHVEREVEALTSSAEITLR